MAGISWVSKRAYAPPKRLFNDPADWGGNGPNVLDALSTSYAAAQKSDKSAWTKISVPQKDSPGATATVPYGAQRALKRTVTEASETGPSILKGRAFDAGAIGKNSGRIVILGQLGANDLEDSYKVSLVTPGKLKLFAPNPGYDSKVPGSKLSLGDAQLELFDAKGKLIASSDTRDAQAFSNWITLSTEEIGATKTKEGSFPGLALAGGDYTVKIKRANPDALFRLTVNKVGELDFTGSVMNDVSKVDGALQPITGEVAVKNSEGVGYLASFLLVKKADGGAAPEGKPGDSAPDLKKGRIGGPDQWELKLTALKPAKSGDPTPNPPISNQKPVSLGVFTLGKTDSKEKSLPPTFAPSGVKISFAEVKTIPAAEGRPAKEEVKPVAGELSFAAKDPDALVSAKPLPGVMVINPGDLKISLEGAKNVSKDKKIDYSLFAVMGDPGATTFYTVKSQPQTPEEKRKAEKDAVIQSARTAAKQSSSGAILSLFS